MEQELKPCPFCGAEAKIKASWGHSYIEAKHQRPCGFYHLTSRFGPFGSEKNAITAWNTRATQAPLIAAMREGVEALEHISLNCQGASVCDGDPTGAHEHNYSIAGQALTNMREELAKIEGEG